MAYIDKPHANAQLLNQRVELACGRAFLTGFSSPQVTIPDAKIYTFPGMHRHCVSMIYAYPFYREIIQKMIDECEHKKINTEKEALKLLNKCLVESDAPATFFDVHAICKSLKISAPKFDTIIEAIEDEGYVERKINPQNRRKYMLSTTHKANKLIPKFRQISRDWEHEVGITDGDDEFKKRLKEIAIRGMEIV